MVSEAPPFWWTKPDWRAYALWPVSQIYGLVAGRRMRRRRRAEVTVPVICVGNFTVGGAGKTPTAIALARAAKARGLKPGFLSRGYGGSLDVTTVVDPHHHRARAVGDEPLLLAREALTVIARKRVKGAMKLVEEGADLIIMDDGFQSAHIHYDYALLVVDAQRGLGNGHIIPGGPVRAPLVDQLRHADAVLRMGKGDAADPVVRLAARAGRPAYDAVARPRPGSGVEGRALLAFAGIGHPDKFFRTVEEAGGRLVATRPFPDHHYYTDENLADLLDQADAAGADLVTTAKDAVRIRHASDVATRLLRRLSVIEIDLEFDPPGIPERIIGDTIAAFER